MYIMELVQNLAHGKRGAANKSSKVLDAWSADNPDGTWKKSEHRTKFQ